MHQYLTKSNLDAYNCEFNKNFEHRLIPWSFDYLYLFNTTH